MNEILVNSFEKRQDSDYDFGIAISREEAINLIQEARQFVEAIASFMKSRNPSIPD